MAQLTINRFKDWYQVQLNGYTLEQFKSRNEAEAYLKIAHGSNPILHRVSNFGQTIKHISIYP